MKNSSVLILFVLALGAFCPCTFPATPAAPQKPRAVGVRPPAVKPAVQVKRLTVTDLTVNDAAAGAPGGQRVQFSVRVTVQEPGRCSIGSVEPVLVAKTADGKTAPVRVISARGASCIQGQYKDDRPFLLTGECPMICDELRGGQATMEFGSDSDNPLPALTQLGVCFNYAAAPDGQQECTWYPLETVNYYRLKKP